MNRMIFVFVVLIFVASVFAMSEPIVVKADPGLKVKLYVWTAGSGPLLNLAEGVVNTEGVFSTTFFSLTAQSVRYQVMIIDLSGKKIYDTKFEGFGTDKPLGVDCTNGVDCVMSVSSLEEVANESEVVPIVKKVSENINQSVQPNEPEMTANAWYLYSIGGLLTFVILMVMWFKFRAFRDWLTRINYFSEDGELARIEAEIKRKDELIARIKEREEKDKKIKLAKEKLREEDRKLKEMIRKKLRR